MSERAKPPKGFRFDPFADARMGLSLFQMEPEDWLVRDERDDLDDMDDDDLEAWLGDRS